MKRKTVVILSILVLAALAVTACSNASPKQAEVPNPLVRYDTLEQVETKMGYTPAVLPASTGFKLIEIYIIDDTLVDLSYQNDKGIEATVRTQKNAEGEISGYMDLSFGPETYNDVPYNIAEIPEDKVVAANFTKDGMTYSMSAVGMDKEAFMNAFTTVIDAVNNQ